ncbi:hypothetical protein [Streptomyces sp. NBC_00316]|uniref:hypothetical protein n=1 Tax=Streptomyces sp. NBC_00316 TaxID=2975710 RepID=UPI002E2E667E|nr:hypothetical protein [Streptomyces sp. NBC_00316]
MEGRDGCATIAAGAAEGLAATRVRAADDNRCRAEPGDEVVHGAIGPRPHGRAIDEHSVVRRSQGAIRTQPAPAVGHLAVPGGGQLHVRVGEEPRSLAAELSRAFVSGIHAVSTVRRSASAI